MGSGGAHRRTRPGFARLVALPLRLLDDWPSRHRHSMTHSTPAPRRMVPVLFLGVLMAALDIAVVGPALPALRTAFGLDERAVAWVFNVFVLFNLLGVPVNARLGDLAGRRRVFTADVGLFAAGSLTVALAPSFAVLLAGRALQGLGASGIFPLASAMVGDAFPPDRRGRVLGLLGAVFGLAFLVGPMLAGILLATASWPWIFALNLPLAAVVAVLGWRVLPAGGGAKGREVDVPGLVVLGALLAALAYGINGVEQDALGRSLASWRVAPFLAAALVLLPAFVWAERRAASPVVRLSLLARRQVWLAGLLAAGAGMTEAAFIFLPGLAVSAFGVSSSSASFMLLPLVVAVTIGSPVAGRLLDRVGSRAIVLAGTAALTAGLAWVAALPAERAAFYGGSVLIGLGLSALLGSALSYILLGEAHEAERTISQGIITLFISVGQLVGAAFIGAVAASAAADVRGYALALAVIAGINAALFLAALALKGRAAEQDALHRASSS